MPNNESISCTCYILILVADVFLLGVKSHLM